MDNQSNLTHMQKKNQIECYTDASYSKYINGSMIGYKIGDSEIVIEFIPDAKNTQAELFAIDHCISQCKEKYPDHQIHIYTDCQKAIRCNEYDDNIILHKMIGHIKKDLRDEKQQIFALVDKAARKELRKKYKEMNKNDSNEHQ